MVTELGHWSMNHVLKNFIWGQVQMFGYFYLFSLLVHWDELYLQFGFAPGTRPTLVGLILIFSYIFAPVNTLSGLLSSIVSRR